MSTGLHCFIVSFFHSLGFRIWPLKTGHRVPLLLFLSQFPYYNGRIVALFQFPRFSIFTSNGLINAAYIFFRFSLLLLRKVPTGVMK